MKDFWDERAREDAFYFVDNRLEYGSPDVERFWARGGRTVDEFLSRLGVAFTPDDRVVEVGCGVGRLTREIARRAALRRRTRRFRGDAGEAAQELNPELENVRWHLGDGESLAGIKDASADACFSHVVFQHIPDPAITLGYVGEMGRVLRRRRLGGLSDLEPALDPRAAATRASGWAAAEAQRSGGLQAVRRIRPGAGPRSTLMSCARSPSEAGTGSGGPLRRGDPVLPRAAAQAQRRLSQLL